MNGRRESIRHNRRSPLSPMHLTTERWLFNIGSNIKTTTAQWLNASDLAGFSGYAGSIPFVRSSTAQWLNASDLAGFSGYAVSIPFVRS